MKPKMKQLKEELKELAVEIRTNKYAGRERQRQGKRCYFEYIDMAFTYRHKHIAYCLLRGRTMKEIENKNRENNEPNASLIKKYMEEYRDEEEALHID